MGEPLKSNCQTLSIMCEDCDYLDKTRTPMYCDQFNEPLRYYSDNRVQEAVKCHECSNIGCKKY